MHIPDAKRNGKLDKKATVCVFVGYPSNNNGYKFYDPTTERMFRSRDVTFSENDFEILKTVNHEFFAGTNGDDENDDVNRDNDIPVDGVNVNPPDVQRPRRIIRPPERMGVITGDWWDLLDVASAAIVDSEEPTTLEEALNGVNSNLWKEAVQSEYDSLKSNETWELAELPHGRNAIGSKWVFKHKRDADGKIHKCKARLVAKGYSQISGVDYDEVFSPVVKYNSIRTLLALVNQHNLELHQMDVKTAYLNGNLEEELFMKQPKGFVNKSHPELVCKLKKSLYGLKQSARCWNKTIDDYLKKSGWVQNDADPCIYIKRFWTNDQERIVIAALYVDDLLIASNDIDALNKEKDSLSTRFEMVDEGEVHYILGMRVKRNRKEGVLSIDQQAFLLSTLK